MWAKLAIFVNAGWSAQQHLTIKAARFAKGKVGFRLATGNFAVKYKSI